MKFAETMGISAVPMSVAQLVAQLCWIDQHVPLFVSESGIGKTAVISAIARAHSAEFVLYSLAHCEPPDVSGPQFPADNDTFVNLRDKRIPFKAYPGEDNRAILAFDEINRAEMTTLNAVFPAFGERRLGVHEFGPNVRVAAMMNPPDEEYAVTGQYTSDPAMRRRVCMICIEHSSTETLRYAKDPQQSTRILPWEDWSEDITASRRNRPWHHAVIDYLTGYPDEMLNRSAREAGRVYACPANWAQVSDTLYTCDRLREEKIWAESDIALTRAIQVKLAGHVGKTVAEALWDTYQKSTEIIDPLEVMREFKTNKQLKKKIERLVARGEVGQLLALNNKIADTWIDALKNEETKLTVAVLGDNISAYMGCTPAQVGKTLMDGLVTADGAKSGSGTSPLVNQLAQKMSQNPDFKDWRARLSAESEKVHDAMREHGTTDVKGRGGDGKSV